MHCNKRRASAANDLFDRLVGATEQRERECDAERLGGLQVDVQLDFSCLLDRQVGGLFTLEDAAGIDAGLSKNVCNVSAVAHQAAGRHRLAHMVNRRHRVACRQRVVPQFEIRLFRPQASPR
jgi:hypothetical protein